MTESARLYPCLRYRSPRPAIDFLIRAFGFEVHQMHESPDGSLLHAELRLGNGLLMLGALDADAVAAGRTVSGGADSIYVSVPYVDAHHDKALAAGAVITRSPTDTDYGSREYSCRDIEGFEWHFGNYDPLKPAET